MRHQDADRCKIEIFLPTGKIRRYEIDSGTRRWELGKSYYADGPIYMTDEEKAKLQSCLAEIEAAMEARERDALRAIYKKKLEALEGRNHERAARDAGRDDRLSRERRLLRQSVP